VVIGIRELADNVVARPHASKKRSGLAIPATAATAPVVGSIRADSENGRNG
jgi:hypothetical protein